MENDPPSIDATRDLVRRHEEVVEMNEALILGAVRQHELTETAEGARASAEAEGQARDRFLAMVSHELRTPLTPVLMGLKMLARRRDLLPAVADVLAMIGRNVEIESGLIDELVDFSRSGSGKLEIKHDPIDVHEILHRALEVAAPDIEGKHQGLTLALDAAEHRVRGDATRLQQVFWNLLKNAAKFTPDHGEIRVVSRNVPSSPHAPAHLAVVVADTGIGFQPEVGQRLFEAFVQASPAITQEFGGLGLGLAISKAIVDAHRGTLRAHSPGDGQGATFTVELLLMGDEQGGVDLDGPSEIRPAGEGDREKAALMGDDGLLPRLPENVSKTVEMNAALIHGLIRQHELAEETERLNARLRAEIGEREEVEKALRASKERFAALFNQTTVGIAELDLEGRFVLINDRFCKLMERTREEMLRLRMQDITHPDDLPKSEAKLHDLVEGRIRSCVLEKRYIRPDGAPLWAQADLAAIHDTDGRVRSLATAVTDISERHLLDDTRVARAAELVRADQSKDEFLAMLAHELRNPLAPMRNAAEILTTSGASAGDHALAHQILARQIENMTRMIDDLLDVSRITEGKIELRKEVVALDAIFSTAAALARPGIAARQQEFTITLPAEPIFLSGDATRLDQVFGNLLTNASKYSGPGSHISLSAERATARAEPAQVIVRVRDDGMGISPDLLPHIFDLFVQASRTLDRAHGGLGIGLTLVHRLVKLHGGSVEARSEGLGHGSEFVVRLPVLPDLSGVPQPSSAPAMPEPPRRILIVDDNEDSSRSMAILQRRRGHDARIAFTGPEAIGIAAVFTPEIVLLDIGLPGMDGFEVARQLRRMPGMDGAFLVAMSGYGNPEDLAHAKAAGFDEYLVKPADLALLREWMRTRV